MKEIIKITGVSFKNDDGEARQDILASLAPSAGSQDGQTSADIITVNLLKQTYFNPETRKNELAIACVEKNTKKQLGFIPRADITPDILKLRQMTGLIGKYKDTYYVELVRQQAPDSEMYENMKKFCKDRNLTMPAYDVRAFIMFLDENKRAAKPRTIFKG